MNGLEPTNEMETIVYFAGANPEEHGFRLVALSQSFPDAKIEWNGTIHRAEFEFLSSNFAAHGHQARMCDLVICWRHDDPGLRVPCIELMRTIWWEPILPQQPLPDWQQMRFDVEASKWAKREQTLRLEIHEKERELSREQDRNAGLRARIAGLEKRLRVSAPLLTSAGRPIDTIDAALVEEIQRWHASTGCYPSNNKICRMSRQTLGHGVNRDKARRALELAKQ